MIANSTEVLDVLDLDRLFAQDELLFDLREGVIFNTAKTRVCMLSTDLLNGIYRGLSEEAGPAWHLIFKNCGLIWGRRLARRVDHETQLLGGKKLGQLTLEQFEVFITSYFQFHGWGNLAFDMEGIRESGILQMTMTDSIFADVITDAEQMVDPMIAGILASLMSFVSGHELDCVQTACVTKGADVSRFVITAVDRLVEAESMAESGQSHEAILERI